MGHARCPGCVAPTAIWSTPRAPEELVIAHALDDDKLDALMEADLDDASPEIDVGTTTVHVDRAAASLAAAMVSAVLDVESAGLSVASVGAPDLVDLPELAAHTGRTRESIRLLARGRRGPGDFPPASHGFYLWAEVRAWFAKYDPSSVGCPSAAALSYDRTIGAAEHLVRARALLGGHGGGFTAPVAA